MAPAPAPRPGAAPPPPGAEGAERAERVERVERAERAAIVVRALQEADRDAWAPLWQGYQAFYEVVLDAAVTEQLWRQVSRPGGAIRGRGAFVGDELVGLVHYLFHPSSWSRRGYCYLEDLFTAPHARTGGIGRALIEAVVGEARAAGLDKVYWQTHETNAVAQVLYNRVANRSGFVVYDIPIA